MPDDSKHVETSSMLNKSPTTFYDLMAIVVNSDGTPAEKRKLIKQLRKANPASEKALFLTVVSILGVVAVGSVLAMALNTGSSSDFLPIITGCIGALSGMLVSRGQSSGAPPAPQTPAAAGITEPHN